MGPTHTQVGVPEEGEKGAAKSFEEIIAKQTFPKFDERYKSKNPKSSTNST